MSAHSWSGCAAAVVLVCAGLVTPAAAQPSKSAQNPKTERQASALADYETQYRDKGFSRDIVELFLAIGVDRAAFDRVQKKSRHSDQRMIAAARDTRDLRLSGRQNLEDISNLTKEELVALKKHAQTPVKSGSKK